MKSVKSNEMVECKGLILGLMVLLTIVLTINSVFAVTGSIGNSRMIISSKTGEVIERTILVRNVNNISVKIEMTSSGDLASDLKILNPNFTLAPGEEKKVNISVKITKEGSTETSVNIKFTGVGEKGGVGLTSTIIINAEKGNLFNFGDNNSPNQTNEFFDKYKLIIISSFVTFILLIIFLILLIIVSKKRKSKEMVKPKEMAKPTKPKKESSKL